MFRRSATRDRGALRESLAAWPRSRAPDRKRSPLRSWSFRHLAVAYVINELGNWVGDVALAVLVFDHTASAVATAALFVSLRFLPAGIAPLLAVRLEVLDTGRVLTASYLLEGLLFAGIVLLASRFSLPAVLVLATIDGVLAVTASALSRSATTALLLPDGALRRGNAFLNLGFSASGTVGPALAGALVGALGAGSALAVDAGTFAAVAAIVATAGRLTVHSDATTGAGGRLGAGFREVWSRPSARWLLGAHALALVFFTAVVPVEVIYAKQTLHAGDSGYGALLTAWGAGMVLGGIAFAAVRRVPLLIVLAASTALIGAGYAGLSVAPGLALACAFSAIGGLGNGAQWVGLLTAVQHAVPAVTQTAVMALLGSLSQVMPAAGFIVGGLLAALASPRTTYAVAAGGVLVVLLAAAALRPGDLPATGAGVRPVPAASD